MSKPTGKLAMAYSTIATMEARIKELECQRPAGVAVPEGWKLVPVEPTEDMTCVSPLEASPDTLRHLWDAMLAAAPHPVSGEQKPDMADAYVGAMEDRNIWKRRALEAEAKIRTYDRRIVDLGVLSMRTAVENPAAQDVAGLVEALEGVVKRCSRASGGSGYVGVDGQYLKVIDAALAAHCAQQGEQPS